MEASPGKSLPSRFQTGPKQGHPIWPRSTTKVDGMKRLPGWGLVPVSQARRALCFLRLLPPPKSVCHLRPSGDRSSATFRDFSTHPLPSTGYSPPSATRFSAFGKKQSHVSPAPFIGLTSHSTHAVVEPPSLLLSGQLSRPPIACSVTLHTIPAVSPRHMGSACPSRRG
jgi:hypothetical protein